MENNSTVHFGIKVSILIRQGVRDMVHTTTVSIRDGGHMNGSVASNNKNLFGITEYVQIQAYANLDSFHHFNR
jgi:hypothetical protein